MKVQDARYNFNVFLTQMNSISRIIQFIDTSSHENFRSGLICLKFESKLTEDVYIAKSPLVPFSDKYYADLVNYGKIIMGQPPSLNNVGNTGWFIIKVEDGE